MHLNLVHVKALLNFVGGSASDAMVYHVSCGAKAEEVFMKLTNEASGTWKSLECEWTVPISQNGCIHPV